MISYEVCKCPLSWKAPLFSSGGDRTGFISVHKFVAKWRKTLQTCHGDVSTILDLLAKPGCNFLEQEDLIPFPQIKLYTILRSIEN
ncbi:serine/threonine-protein phosphatase 2A regulatory subunit B'' subunit beta [Oncorhynchus masou masou]|uniref:serine/threonine-protein phosphatase 2A regulatory subunit B'' subunit beta n=1 Tax=Oncorhynchus masou masou TaxID=90313 RepID=UPI00318449BB